MKIVVGILMLFSFINVFAATVSNPEASGHSKLENVPCVDLEKLNNKYTPPELYDALKQCVAQNKYKEAVFLFSLAGVYGHFDMLRVTDNTAAEIVPALIGDTFDAIGEDKKNSFKKEFDKAMSTSGLGELCKRIILIGPPDYYPDYMIQHGMKAFLEQDPNGPINKNFDAQGVWKKLLGTYFHCPGYEASKDIEKL